MNKRHYEHTLPNIRGSLSNTYILSSYYLYCVRLLVVGVVVGPVQVADNKRNRVAIWVSVLWL